MFVQLNNGMEMGNFVANDVGDTFFDCMAVDQDCQLHRAESLFTKADLIEGMVNGLAYGTTIGVNFVVERNRTRVALLCTRVHGVAILMMRVGGRFVVCRQVAEYHLPAAQRPGLHQLGRFLSHRLSMRGLFVYDHADRWSEAIAQMAEWMGQDRLALQQSLTKGAKNLRDAIASCSIAARPAGSLCIMPITASDH